MAPLAPEEIPTFAAMNAAGDFHRPFGVPGQPAEGEREAGGEGDDSGAVAVEVHGGHLGFYGVQLSRNSSRHKLSVSTCVST